MPLTAEKKALYAYNKRMKRYAQNGETNIIYKRGPYQKGLSPIERQKLRRLRDKLRKRKFRATLSSQPTVDPLLKSFSTSSQPQIVIQQEITTPILSSSSPHRVSNHQDQLQMARKPDAQVSSEFQSAQQILGDNLIGPANVQDILSKEDDTKIHENSKTAVSATPPPPPDQTSSKKTPSKKYNNQSHAARYLKQQTCIGTDIWLNANEIISKPKVPIKRKFTHCKRCELLQKKLEIICRKWPISKKLSLTRYSQSLLENDPQVPKKIIKKKVLPPSQPQTKTSTITPTNRLDQLHRARRQDAEKRRQSEKTAKALEEFYSNTSLFAPPTREQSSNNNVVTILGEFKEANILNYGIGSNFPSSTPVQQIIKYK